MHRIEKIEDNEEKIRVMKECDSTFPIKLFSRSNCEDIVKRITEYAFFYAAYELDNNNKQPIGYVAFYANDLTTRIAFISNIGVVKGYQKQRLGSQLMKIALDESRRRGMTVMRLEVNVNNEKAINFYRHWGFENENDRNDNSMFLVRNI